MSNIIIVDSSQEKITKLTLTVKLRGEIESMTLTGSRLIEATMKKFPEALVEKLSKAVRYDRDFLCWLPASESEELQLLSKTTPADRVRFLLRIFFAPFAGFIDREIWHSGKIYHIYNAWQMYLSARRILAESYVEIITVRSL